MRRLNHGREVLSGRRTVDKSENQSWRVVKQVAETNRPVLLTSRGRGVAIVQSVTEFESAEEERAFMRAVVEGLFDLERGHEVSLHEVKAKLGIK